MKLDRMFDANNSKVTLSTARNARQKQKEFQKKYSAK